MKRLKRTKRIHVALSEKEHETLYAKAAERGMTVGELIRFVVIREK